MPRPQGVPIASDASPPSGLNILLEARDEKVREQITNLLEPFGNRIIAALSAADAIAIAGRHKYDAIIAGAADADTLSAAPGVKAPVLALLNGNGRVPEAAGGILHWPAQASELYAALREMLGRAADSVAIHDPEDRETAAAIDASAFASLEKSLGLTTLIEILQSYIKTAEELCGNLSRASHDQSWDEAGRIAQDIAGAAGGLGLSALTSAARGFAQKAREGSAGEELQNAAKTIMGEHERVRKALANLYPDVAA